MGAIPLALTAQAVTADDFWQHLQKAAEGDHVLLVVAAFIVTALFLLRVRSIDRSSVRSACGLFGFALLLLMSSPVARWAVLPQMAVALRAAGLMIGGVAIVNLVGLLLFNVVLSIVRINTPKILRDLLSLLGYIAIAMWLMRQGGMTLSGIITTSAVLTAVIGFSLQDTLGNIMGGLALQMEKTINEGDWIQIGTTQGKVKEIRWRHTSIETRNWDTLVIPNSMLMKGEVMILGRRTGQPIQHRMWVYFNVDYRTPPADVIQIVENALRSEDIPNVAKDPAPNCITWLYKESYMEYAVRYWLTDLLRDDPTNSEVRLRIYYALRRAGIPLSIPAHQLFVTDEHAHREHHQEREIARRVDTLSRVELFHTMNPEELRKLAERLTVAPFTTGESMTRQGADAHYLYVITKGAGEVFVSADGGLRKTVAKLAMGDFFGEIGMMTGGVRNATVVALTPTECYRLDKDAFRDILNNRPEIAEHISLVIARRSVELEAVRHNLDSESRARMLQPAQQDIFARMAALFGFGDSAKAAKAN